MSGSLSIRFQSPEHLTGPMRDVFALLSEKVDAGAVSPVAAVVEPLALPPSREQDLLDARLLRQRFRQLERERSLKMVDGTATWVVTDLLSFDPDLAKRVDHAIIGEGLGKGRIIFGPPDFWLPPGHYMATIEFQITSMLDAARARVSGEVVLGNKDYLSRQTKIVFSRGSYTFRLPFSVRENDLLKSSLPTLQIRLNLRAVVGIAVTQVAVAYTADRLRHALAHPGAYLSSMGNAWVRRLWKRR